MAELAEQATLNSSRRVRLEDVRRWLTLYTVLVLYSAVYEQFYAVQLTPLIHNEYIAYDFAKSSIYMLLNFLTPLAVLPIGTRLRTPGQFIAGALAVLLFIPIPIVFVPMVTASEFWEIYILLWFSYFTICTLASISWNIRLPALSEREFGRMLLCVYALYGLAFVYALATNHISVVGLESAHEARKEVTVSGIQGYLLVSYVTSFSGLLIAVALMLRKYYILPLALAGFVTCYAVLAERNAAFMPAWVLYIYLAHRLFFRDSVTKYLLIVMAPFLCGTFFATILGLADTESFLYFAFMMANFRIFSIPAVAFNLYYNFFATHPLTYWSHINIVSNFVSYPYGEPLSLVMADAYGMGNYNASFLETDGLAAAGAAAIPFISMVLGLALTAINSCMRGLNVTICAIVMAGPSIALMDTGFGPAMLTNGLAPLALFLLFAPRISPWNSESGNRRQL